MQVEKFEHSILTISLTGDDCAILATCLQAATAAGAFDLAGQEFEGALCGALTSAFTLGAVACASNGWVSFGDRDKLVEDLQAVGLGHLTAGTQDVLAQAADALKD